MPAMSGALSDLCKHLVTRGSRTALYAATLEEIEYLAGLPKGHKIDPEIRKLLKEIRLMAKYALKGKVYFEGKILKI